METTRSSALGKWVQSSKSIIEKCREKRPDKRWGKDRGLGLKYKKIKWKIGVRRKDLGKIVFQGAVQPAGKIMKRFARTEDK